MVGYLIFFILICVALFFIKRFLKQFKIAKIGALCMVTGGVKCGKSTLAVSIVRSEYRSRVRSVKIKNFFRKMFKKELLELPLIYSNIPLAMPYVPITEDLFLRKTRFVYGSVVYIQEASLVADSQLIKDQTVNEQMLLFFKLIGHETHGGCVVVDTQSVSDVHYSLKRTLSEYIYIHHLVKWIPFFLIGYVEEHRYSDDGTIISTSSEDVENKLRKVIIRKSTWKYFDCYNYSVLTDKLPVEKRLVKNNKNTQDLKCRKIVSFRPNFKKLSEEDNEK